METETVFLGLMGLSIAICVLGVVLNVLMLWAIARSRQITRLDFAGNINLAVADLLCALLVIAVLVSRLAGTPMAALCQVYACLLSFSNSLSLYTLISMCVIHALVFSAGLSMERFRWLFWVCLLWVGSLLCAATPFLMATAPFVVQPSKLYCTVNFFTENRVYFAFNISIVAIIFMSPIVIGIGYLNIYRSLVSVSSARTNRGEVVTQAQRNIQVTIVRRALYLMVSFGMFWYFPSIIFTLQIATRKPVTWEWDAMCACLLLLKNSINPVVFFLVDPRCKNSLYEIFGCKTIAEQQRESCIHDEAKTGYRVKGRVVDLLHGTFDAGLSYEVKTY